MTNSTNQQKKGTRNFRPRARLVSVLGEQLIRDATVGLLELIKNGYDADADKVTVKLLNLSEPAKTTIIVEDDGYGMDLDTVLHKWLEPATGHKEAAKKKEQRSAKGRLPLGEKGVGRFAAHKLGRHLTLISRAQDAEGVLNPDEVVITIDWDEFDDPEAYLSEVAVNYEACEPEHFVDSSGTFMEMRHSRTSWKEKDVSRVSRTLRRLMSPFRTPKSFRVSLECPDYPKYEDLDASELLKTAHASLAVMVDEEGIAEYDYNFALASYPSREIIGKTTDIRKEIDNWMPTDRKSVCGPFFVTFYIWDRKRGNLRLSGTNPTDLNQVIGVSVFRDGIRVMPYGEPEDDWLEIDQARVMRSSKAFERRNVVGAIEIDQVNNKNLHDKSNREGFIENEAFTDLYDLMQAIMQIAYIEFSADRKKVREAEEEAKKELTPAVQQLEKNIASVTQILEKTRSMAEDFVTQEKITPDVAQQMLAVFDQTGQNLAAAVVDTKQAVTATIAIHENEREMLFELAGLGLATERFTHEFARLTRESADVLRQVKRMKVIQESVEATNRINTIRVTIEALQDLVLALGPLFYIRRKTQEKEFQVKTIIEYALLLNEGQIADYQIKVEVDEQGEMGVLMRMGSLTQVLNNLIDNACYWLKNKSREDDRRLKITVLADERQLIIADNGPGVQPNYKNRIFDPFFSTKAKGRGLGLYISKETLEIAKARLELLNPGEHPATFRVGAAFLIQFSNENQS